MDLKEKFESKFEFDEIDTYMDKNIYSLSLEDIIQALQSSNDKKTIEKNIENKYSKIGSDTHSNNIKSDITQFNDKELQDAKNRMKNEVTNFLDGVDDAEEEFDSEIIKD